MRVLTLLAALFALPTGAHALEKEWTFTQNGNELTFRINTPEHATFPQFFTLPNGEVDVLRRGAYAETVQHMFQASDGSIFMLTNALGTNVWIYNGERFWQADRYRDHMLGDPLRVSETNLIVYDLMPQSGAGDFTGVLLFRDGHWSLVEYSGEQRNSVDTMQLIGNMVQLVHHAWGEDETPKITYFELAGGPFRPSFLQYADGEDPYLIPLEPKRRAKINGVHHNLEQVVFRAGMIGTDRLTVADSTGSYGDDEVVYLTDGTTGAIVRLLPTMFSSAPTSDASARIYAIVLVSGELPNDTDKLRVQRLAE